ncbi:MAG: folylpolyglutamate synthase/dihydrofolate synthase family protein [Bacteroidota bacterium]
MTYKATLEWMYAQLPMYQKKGISAFKGKLDNSMALAEHLGHPERRFKSIHVAGTNGKGSSCHMLASVLQEAGYTTGLYTSPHLKDFRERIRINGKMIPKDVVKEFVAQHRSFFEHYQLSFFEMTVGMAFYYFAEQQVDIAIIEVGLGGRLDSTNIIRPEVCLITNIGYDHQEILGDTLQKIALEKAGIIKRNVPVVISERQKETETIFRMIASQKKAPIEFADDQDIPSYKTDLLGEYQQKNSKGVVACLAHLAQFSIPEAARVKGLKNVVPNTGILGRWHILKNQPRVVCDTAHNKAGLEFVIRQLGKQQFRKLHLVLGFVSDKNVAELLDVFPEHGQYYFVTPNIPRGMKAEEVKKIAAGLGYTGKCYSSVKKGLKKALALAKKEDMIFIGGSTFVVAEVV